MKLSGIGATTGTSKAGRAGGATKSSPGAFSQHLSDTSESEAVDGARGVESSSAVANIDALLAAQSVGDSLEEESRKRMVKRGEDLLDQLEELRHGLLMGEIPKEKLVALGEMVRSRRDSVSDPHLAAILDEIELRAEVELAKLTRDEG